MQNWKYVKIFDEEECRPSRPELFELLGVLSELEGKGDSSLPAGYTYFGQFIDHDVSLLLENAKIPDARRINRTGRVDELTLARKPGLDLDSMYGGGLSDSIVPFDEHGKFLLGDTGYARNRDFKRDPLFRPLIADRRNDENLFVAQVQVLFMNLHNKIVDDLRDESLSDPDERFARARTEVVRIYQYLVLHDFLPQLVPDRVYRNIILRDQGKLTESERPTMALEVSEAVFRLHALVRPFYSLNLGRDVSLDEIVDIAGAARRAGSLARPLLRAEDEVDWRLFFTFERYYPGEVQVQRASQISPVMSPRLLDLPSESGRPLNMLELNILRGIVRGLCSGQHAVESLSERHKFIAKDLQLGSLVSEENYLLRKLSATNSIRAATPLWLYVTLEAGDGGQLGDLGGWLLADALRTAAVNADVRLPNLTDRSPEGLYAPFLDAVDNPDAITIADVIMYAYGLKR